MISTDYMVVYPVKYTLDDHNPEKHSAQGIDDSGRKVMVYLDIDEKFRDRDKSPSIEKLSTPGSSYFCQADPENEPRNRHGALLFTRLHKASNTTLDNVFIAKWVILLAKNKEDPEPFVGTGRIDYLTSQASKNTKISCVLYDTNAQWSSYGINPDEGEIRASIDSSFIKFSAQKGFTIRGLAANDKTIELLTKELYLENSDLDDLLFRINAIYREFIGNRHVKSINFIPIIRVNSTRDARSHYEKKSIINQTLKSFYDNSGLPFARTVAITLENATDNRESLFHRIFPLSDKKETVPNIQLTKNSNTEELDSSPLSLAELFDHKGLSIRSLNIPTKASGGQKISPSVFTKESKITGLLAYIRSQPNS